MPVEAQDSDEYGVSAEYYDYVPPYVERRDVDFFVDMARESSGPVLEVGCGTGRVLIPTARAGIDITGVDLSPGMLSICRKRLQEEMPQTQALVTLVEADMRDFALNRTFALITLPFRPFQHLVTVEDQMACLKTLRRHMRAGARLVLDLFNPSIPLLADETRSEERQDGPEVTLPDGRRFYRTFRVTERDYFAQVQQVEMFYYVTHVDGRTERRVHAFPMRYIFRFEAEHLLARCGFSIEHLYAGFDRSEYGAKYPGELMFVARTADA